ncbi:MAG: ABC transporter ATP-binding protein [Acholeplasmataceae bacterium]
MILLKNFRHYYIKYGIAYVLGLSLLVLVDYFQLEIPRTLNAIITGVDKGEFVTTGDFMPLITYIITLVLTIALGRFLWRFLLLGSSRKIETDIRLHMLTHATTLSQDFYGDENIGGLMSYFINDLNAIREIYGFGLLMLVDGLTLGIMVLIRMFGLNYLMTLYAFIPILLMAILVFILNKKMEYKFKERQESFQSMSHFTQESLTGISVIKAYVREIKESFTFKKRADDVKDKTMAHVKYVVLVNIIVETMISLVVLSILVYSSFLIAKSELDAGDLTEYITYFFTLLWPVTAIAMFLNLNGQAQASAKRIYKFLETKPTIKDHENVIKDPNLTGEITLNDLTFKYKDNKEPTLKDISLTIKSGEMVGILGKTGSGKSTLVELLLHVYSVKPGMIFFDEYDIRNISIHGLRKHIGYVPQDNFLYSDTIKNNIGFGLEEIDDNYLEEIAKLSDIHDNVIEFKEQYDTILGERGTTVSGGQKQRISIARALALDPTILILDDSVSAVDYDTEEKIINNLRNIRKNKTTIIIAHRISTVKKLDKIILLEDGKVIGFDSHDNLLKDNIEYQKMVKLQELKTLVGEEI